jgi:hypothetical protein
MTIFVYMCSGLSERQDTKMASVAGEGIVLLRSSSRRSGSIFIAPGVTTLPANAKMGRKVAL